MITRHYTRGDAPSQAVYSDCERYRYSLTRAWDPDGLRVMFVMLNPSQATERHNDPTVARCEARARRLGYGALRVTNLFAWRATDPRDMRAQPDPTGPDNDQALREGMGWADHIIAAWGTHGAHLGRGPQAARLLCSGDTPVFHLGLSKHGHPRHPLYLPYDLTPLAWDNLP